MLASLLAAGCGREPASPPRLTAADMTGTYVATLVAGHSEPSPYGPGATFVADTVTLRIDRSR